MAVQFNLLPDVKLQYNQSQRTKKIVYLTSGLAAGAVLAVLLLSFLSVDILQSKLLSDANKDIQTVSKNIKNIQNLDKILTVQNQLSSLPSLHGQTHDTSRLFTYLPQLIPDNASINDLKLDTKANTISMEGAADSVETINKLIDTWKFTNYTNNNGPQTQAFSNVVLSQIGRNDKNASFSINTNYDPALFNPTANINLIVPNKITTRSVVNSPSLNSLFQPSKQENP